MHPLPAERTPRQHGSAGVCGRPPQERLLRREGGDREAAPADAVCGDAEAGCDRTGPVNFGKGRAPGRMIRIRELGE